MRIVSVRLKITESEKRLCNALQSLGLRPRKQYKISRMRIDLAFPHQKVAVEVDGSHHRSDVRQIESDMWRTKYLEENGWKVLHYTNKQVYEKVVWCAEDIRSHINKK